MKKRFLCLTLGLLLTVSQVAPVGAATRKEQLKQDKAAAQSQLAAQESKIDSLESQKQTLSAEINQLDSDLVNIMVEIEILDGELSDKEAQIEQTKADLEVAEANKQKQYEAMKKRIQYLYEKGGDDAWAQMLFQATDFTSLLNQAEYVQQMYDSDRNSLEEYKETVQQVTDLGNQLDSEKAELEEMNQEYQNRQASMQEQLEQKKATSSGDTTCWVNDFRNSDNEAYLRSYFSNPAYNDYPVVGVTWEQANAFCAWRTDYLLKGLGPEARFVQRYRLPTEAEWEYAARGKNQNEFPWENQDVKNGDGCFYANFKPDRGNYTKDGNLITSKVGIYSPNSNGLYDMAGNVAEWTSTIYTEAGVDAMNDLNPELKYNAAKEDPYRLKKKSVRGGSWKDPESFIRSAWRSWEYQNQPRSYIGFRCVRSLATTSSAKQKPSKNKNRR